MIEPRPLRIAEQLLDRSLPPEVREDILGDLEESFRRRAAGRPWAARLWYVREAVSLAALYRLEIKRERLVGRPSEMLDDFRYALRSLRRQLGFALVVALILGLGMGANVAVFSFVQAILLRPMPYPDAERLVVIRSVRGEDPGPLSLREVEDFREAGIFESVAAYFDTARYNIAEGGSPELVQATVAARELFETLGVRPIHGDLWPKSYDLERSFGVLLSHDLWQSRFEADPSVIGSTMTMDGAPGYTIFGVLPPDFSFPMASGVFRCIGVYPNYTDRNVRYMSALGRLPEDLNLAQAQTRLDAISRTLSEEFPDSNAGVGFRIDRLRDIYAGDLRPYLQALWAAVSLILILVVANLINLLLARATTRSKQYGVMAALGASRLVIARRMFAESLLLAALGGAAGAAFAVLGLRVLAEQVRASLPAWMEVELDWVSLAYALGLAIAVGLVVGVAPALRFSRPDLKDVLASSARNSSGNRRQRGFRTTLVAVQVAIAALLLVSAGLTVQSFERLQAADLGFQPQGLLTLRPTLNWRDYRGESAKTNAFLSASLEGIANLPGVGSAAAISRLPLSGRMDSLRTPFSVDGQGPAEKEANPYVLHQLATSGLFDLIETPLLEGRDLTDFDDLESEPVAIISKALAQRLWPGESALNRRIRLGEDEDETPWRRIVGVAGDLKFESAAGPPTFTVYTPFYQSPTLGAAIVARSKTEPLAMAEAAKRAVWAIDPAQGISEVAAVERIVADSVWQQRLAGTLFALFALLAAAVAGLGVYGVLSHLVAQRQREIGIRMALGARRRDALLLVLSDALRPAAIGVGGGLALAVFASRSLSALLYEVSATDWTTYGAAAGFLLLVAFGAALIPARRAARVEPIASLRSE